MVLSLWVYYAALIFLFGAELTQVYTRSYGSGLEPEEHAEVAPEAHEKEEHAEATVR